MRDQLENQQNEIMTVLDRLDHLFSHCGPDNIVALGETRVGFNDLLQRHFQFKETLYRTIRANGSGPADRLVGRSRSQMMALIVAYRFHTADWSPKAMLADWSGYMAASRALITRVRTAIKSDREQIYPLLDSQTASESAKVFGEDRPRIFADHHAVAPILAVEPDR